jgi:hypothetical protein
MGCCEEPITHSNDAPCQDEVDEEKSRTEMVVILEQPTIYELGVVL